MLYNEKRSKPHLLRSDTQNSIDSNARNQRLEMQKRLKHEHLFRENSNINFNLTLVAM